MGGARDVYSAANWWYSGYQHTTDMKDNVGWNMAAIGTDFIGFMQPWAQQAGKALGATKFVEAAETPIIEVGLLSMMAMSNLCGFGHPDKGQGAGLGSDAFTKIDDALGTTQSPESWSGDASGAYSDQNDAQRHRARSVAAADRDLQHVLEREADQVQHTRDTIDHRTTVLTAAIIPAVIAYSSGPWGPAVSLGIQAAAVAATVPFALERFEQLVGQSFDNASAIREVAAAYHQAAAISSASATSGGNKVTATPSDLQHLADRQDQVAESMTQAGETTHETCQNVVVSHGMVCTPSSIAVGQAVSARTAAAATMHSASTGLATDLRTAAGRYDATDRDQREHLEGQVR